MHTHGQKAEIFQDSIEVVNINKYGKKRKRKREENRERKKNWKKKKFPYCVHTRSFELYLYPPFGYKIQKYTSDEEIKKKTIFFVTVYFKITLYQTCFDNGPR